MGPATRVARVPRRPSAQAIAAARCARHPRAPRRLRAARRPSSCAPRRDARRNRARPRSRVRRRHRPGLRPAGPRPLGVGSRQVGRHAAVPGNARGVTPHDRCVARGHGGSHRGPCARRLQRCRRAASRDASPCVGLLHLQRSCDRVWAPRRSRVEGRLRGHRCSSRRWGAGGLLRHRPGAHDLAARDRPHALPGHRVRGRTRRRQGSRLQHQRGPTSIYRRSGVRARVRRGRPAARGALSAGCARDPAGHRHSLRRPAHASSALHARSPARRALVRVDAVPLGRDGRRRIRPRRGAPHVVDGIPPHARRSDPAGAPRPAPAALERQREDRSRQRDRSGRARGARSRLQLRVPVAELHWPRQFAAWALRTGALPQALACIALAMIFSTAGAYRMATSIRVEDIVFGSTRSPAVDTLLGAIGVERTAVLVYLLQRSFDALVVASALTPIFLWLLGSSAMHAAARLRGARGHPFTPLPVLFAYAELVYQAPASLAGIIFGAQGAGAQLATALSLVMLVWFGMVIYRGIELHYEVPGDRARAIFVMGALVFYLVPLVLIVGTLVAIVMAAAILQYF